MKVKPDEQQYPELENDYIRQTMIIEMLEEFPSVRHDIIEYLKDEFPRELE